MEIQLHERVHLNTGASLSREEAFSRRQQQNDAILMKWDRRKARLILKDKIGVLRKTLNSLKNISFTAREDLEESVPKGRVNLTEVTVFKVNIGGIVKEVVVRLHTCGAVMFQFLEKDSGKIRIAGTGVRSEFPSIPEPYIATIDGWSDQDELYRGAMRSIVDYLVNGAPPVKEQTLADQVAAIPTIFIMDPELFTHELSIENDPTDLKLPYVKFMLKMGDDKTPQVMVVSKLNDHEVFIEFATVDSVDEVNVIGTGLIIKHEGEQLDITSKVDDQSISREQIRANVLTLVGLIKALESEGVETTNQYRGPGNESIPVPPAALADGFNIVRYVIGRPKAGKSPWQGDTHAAPREHTRIAHWRTLASGERVWIPEVVVNRDEGGRIMKTYVVTKA